MQVKLRVMRGSNAGKEIGFKGPKFVIGRSEECQLQARSDAISRQHCVILIRSTGPVVRDLGSRNGTYVNGTRIDGDHALNDGDQLQIGPLEFSVIVQASASSSGILKTATSASSAASGQSSTTPGVSAEKVGDLVNRWLEELDEAAPADPEAATHRDTTRFYSDDTEAVTVDPASGVAANPDTDTKAETILTSPRDRDAAAGSPAAGADGKPAGKRQPGKLPKRDPDADRPKNTQEAAAQMLRKMWHRR